MSSQTLIIPSARKMDRYDRRVFLHRLVTTDQFVDDKTHRDLLRDAFNDVGLGNEFEDFVRHPSIRKDTIGFLKRKIDKYQSKYFNSYDRDATRAQLYLYKGLVKHLINGTLPETGRQALLKESPQVVANLERLLVPKHNWTGDISVVLKLPKEDLRGSVRSYIDIPESLGIRSKRLAESIINGDTREVNRQGIQGIDRCFILAVATAAGSGKDLELFRNIATKVKRDSGKDLLCVSDIADIALTINDVFMRELFRNVEDYSELTPHVLGQLIHHAASYEALLALRNILVIRQLPFDYQKAVINLMLNIGHDHDYDIGDLKENIIIHQIRVFDILARRDQVFLDYNRLLRISLTLFMTDMAIYFLNRIADNGLFLDLDVVIYPLLSSLNGLEKYISVLLRVLTHRFDIQILDGSMKEMLLKYLQPVYPQSDKVTSEYRGFMIKLFDVLTSIKPDMNYEKIFILAAEALPSGSEHKYGNDVSMQGPWNWLANKIRAHGGDVPYEIIADRDDIPDSSKLKQWALKYV